MKTEEESKFYTYLKYIGFTTFAVLMIHSLKGCYDQRQERKEIIKNKAFTRGKVVKYGHSGIADHYVDFIYEVNGVTYRNGQAGISLPCASNFNYKGCIGAEYWVIYSKKILKRVVYWQPLICMKYMG
tara:strand:+ start:1250 stop:1633 length:384 start_codon:yes stop_codon:yes gene_type:complete